MPLFVKRLPAIAGRLSPSPTVVPHPADLSADLIEPLLDAGALIWTERAGVIPMHPPDPIANAVEFTLNPVGFMMVEATIRTPAIDPVLQELNSLTGPFGRAPPEGARVPTSRRRSRLGSCHRCRKYRRDCCCRPFHYVFLLTPGPA
jgi:hypothetical protein